MAETLEDIQPSEKNLNNIEVSAPSTPNENESESEDVVTAAHQHNVHINLSWRSWVVVFVSCFA
jgi:hypothetical protein